MWSYASRSQPSQSWSVHPDPRAGSTFAHAIRGAGNPSSNANCMRGARATRRSSQKRYFKIETVPARLVLCDAPIYGYNANNLTHSRSLSYTKTHNDEHTHRQGPCPHRHTY
eukprot:scaffold820_cov104-Isochrysis_galbana.AAC.7